MACGEARPGGAWALALAWLVGCVGGPGAEAPPSIDLRPEFARLQLPPRAQGARPTCSICTTVGAFEFAVAKARGHGERLSAEYCNWAANAATGRRDDGDFFASALHGVETFGLCREDLQPYVAQFDAAAAPTAAALVDGGRLLGEFSDRLQVHWIRPNDGRPGLTATQFDAVLATLAAGWPVAAGAGHSRLLVGYRADATAPGGGVFTTLDSALAAFAEVPAAFVQTDVCDAFFVSTRP